MNVHTNSSSISIALSYRRMGWRVIPIPRGSKAPKTTKWQLLQVTEAEIPKLFDRYCNIGVILDGGLVDSDLDCIEAIELAPEILPPTPAVFGRKSKPESHWVYQISGTIPAEKFTDPLTGEMLLELRAGGGLQTVFPGSTHPSGEVIAWFNDEAFIDEPPTPAEVDAATLCQAFRQLAARSLVKRYYKGTEDLTDDTSFEEALKTLDQRTVERVQSWLGSLPSASEPHHNGSLPILGPLPVHLKSIASPPISEHLAASLKPPWSAAEQAHLESALAALPANERESWVRVGMALKELDWERPDGTSISFELWDVWSHTCPDKYSLAACEDQWRSFKRSGVTVASVYHMAREHGWAGGAPAPAAASASAGSDQRVDPNGETALPAALLEARQVPTPKQREFGPKEKLIRIGAAAELWHDKDRITFATITAEGHCEHYAVKSQAFRDWLLDAYGTQHRFTMDGQSFPSAPGEQQIKDAINTIAAKARSGAEYQPAVRVAEVGKRIYIDLGAPDWSAVEISSDGWSIVPNPPVRFLRAAGLLPLPFPTSGGNIREFKNFLKMTDSDFVLTVGWLLAALRPTGPYPILIVNGEHGSGKSVLCNLLRQLSDPNTAALRSYPRDERDLALAAKNGWVLALDNLSGLKNDLSDMLCRIATGAAFGTRRLYSDDEEILIKVCRPILLNGIPPLANRADLASRSIVLSLPTMSKLERRSEQEFWLAFGEAAPRLLGALLDGVSGALRNLHSVDLRTRMMDFANFAEAGWRALGLSPGAFEEIYAQNGAQAEEDALDADPVASAILRLLESKPEWTGTATQLLTALTAHAPGSERDRGWPHDATRLSGNLSRLAPLLRSRGIQVERVRASNSGRGRSIYLRRIDKK